MKMIQLPITEPLYGSCEEHFCVGIAVAGNPSLNYWYYNHVSCLRCSFCDGEIGRVFMDNSGWMGIMHLLEFETIPKFFLKDFGKKTICAAIENGYYVIANGCADLRCFCSNVDGLGDCILSGYNDYGNTYTVSSYHFPNHTVYVDRNSFHKCIDNDSCEYLLLIRPLHLGEDFNIDLITDSIRRYLDSDFDMKMLDGNGSYLLGIGLYDVMQQLIAKDLFRHKNFSLLSENILCMQKRIRLLEDVFDSDRDFSRKFFEINMGLLSEDDKLIKSADISQIKSDVKKLLCEVLTRFG